MMKLFFFILAFFLGFLPQTWPQTQTEATLMQSVKISEPFIPPTLRWSPEMALALPQPLQLGVQGECLEESLFCSPRVRFFSTIGYFRYPFSGGSKALSIFSLEMGNRVFPFSRLQGGVFFSLGMGFRKMALSSSDISAFKVNDETLVTEADLRLNTLYLSPGVGWEFRFSKSLMASVELGAQISLWGSGNAYLENTNTGETSDNSSTLKIQSGKALDRIAGLLIPRLTLLRLTWEL